MSLKLEFQTKFADYIKYACQSNFFQWNSDDVTYVDVLILDFCWQIKSSFKLTLVRLQNLNRESESQNFPQTCAIGMPITDEGTYLLVKEVKPIHYLGTYQVSIVTLRIVSRLL